MKSKNKKEPIEHKIFIGLFRGVWWLISLPFKVFRKKPSLTLSDQKYLITRKNQIKDSLMSENIYELSQTVIEADKIVDWLLKKRGYQGQTFADRLRSAEKDIPKIIYNKIWNGHKIRNQIAHDDTSFTKSELKIAICNLLEEF